MPFPDELPTLKAPELIIGICSPLGTDNSRIEKLISRSLTSQGYSSEFFKVTDLMQQVEIDNIELINTPYHKRYDSYIKYANHIRSAFQMQSALAAICCQAIRSYRKEKFGIEDKYVENTGYIFNQFKRPEEISLMRSVYGRLFILISAFSDKSNRIDKISGNISKDKNEGRTSLDTTQEAQRLISRDEYEEGISSGQRMSDAFSMADVFINIDNEKESADILDKFFDLLFGSNRYSPSRDEHGMYLAKTASLKSLDISRQVGAAVLSSDGDIMCLGSNDVPKCSGGTYWQGDPIDKRDYAIGSDKNEDVKRSIITDFVEKIAESGFFKKDIEIDDIKNSIIQESKQKGSGIRDSKLMDLLEFGRVIHAEMDAITSASRRGICIERSILYCTTYPCHMCAKHIVASGISEVIYIEPYPKSYAEELHKDSISGDISDRNSKVIFRPFIGISPYRYRDLYERGKRKDDDGKFVEWMSGNRKLIIRYTVSAYLNNEEAIGLELKKATEKGKNKGVRIRADD